MTNAKLASNAVTTGKVLDNNLTAADIADGSLGSADITNHSLTSDDTSLASGTFTSDFASIPANTCVSTSTPVAGVLSTDAVIVNPPIDITAWPLGLVVVAYAAGGGIAVDVCNVATSATADPDPTTFRYVVIR